MVVAVAALGRRRPRGVGLPARRRRGRTLAHCPLGYKIGRCFPEGRTTSSLTFMASNSLTVWSEVGLEVAEVSMRRTVDASRPALRATSALLNLASTFAVSIAWRKRAARPSGTFDQARTLFDRTTELCAPGASAAAALLAGVRSWFGLRLPIVIRRVRAAGSERVRTEAPRSNYPRGEVRRDCQVPIR